MADFDPTTDWTPPTEAEGEAIRAHFDRGSDRAARRTPNPLFGGRKNLIDNVARDLRRLRESKEPIENLTRVLYGAPGAGKSEVLVQLAAEFSQWMEGDSPILVVRANRACLTDPVAFGEAVYAAADLPRDKVTVELTKVEAGGSLGVVKGSAVLERRAHRSGTVLGRVVHVINRDCRNPTILLLVDEAQKKLVDVGDLPLDLHEANADLKVLPVYAGLGDTLDRLADAGVSRLDVRHAHRMEPLPEHVAGDMSRKALCALASTPDKVSVGKWAVEIVRRCDGWPMHLTHCLLAVRDRHRAVSGRTLTDEDFGRAMAAAGVLRQDYYNRLLKRCPELDPMHYEAWGALFAEGTDAYPADVAKALALSKAETAALLDKALRAGLVENPEPHLYVSPIPSLARHTADLGRAYAHRQKRRPLGSPPRAG